MKAVVPAAGLGTRMLPATKAVPKTLLPVVDRPTLGYVLDEALAAGAEEAIVVVADESGPIRDHLAREPDLEEALAEAGKPAAAEALREAAHPDDVRLVRQPEPRGLGDAVLRAREAVGDQAFLVLCADDIVPSRPTASDELAEAHEDLGGSVFAVRDLPREEVARYGAIAADPVGDRPGTHRVRDVVEKPDPAEAPSTLSTMGRYLFTPAIFPHLEATEPRDGELELSDAMARMAREGTLHAVEWEGDRYDIGTPAGFLEANLAMALRRRDIGDEVRDVATRLLEGELGSPDG